MSRVSEDSGNIARGERFIFALCEEEWTLISGGDDLIGEVGAQGDDGIGAADELKGVLNGVNEIVCHFVGVLNEMGDDFRIGFGFKHVSALFQLLAQFEKVFDNAVMDDGKFSVAMGMGVGFAWSTMGSPTGVTNSRRAGNGVVLEFFEEVFEFSVGTSAEDGAVSANGNSGRIVAAISEPTQAILNDRDTIAKTRISDNTAHFD